MSARRLLLARTVGVTGATVTEPGPSGPSPTPGATTPDIMFANFDDLGLTAYGAVTKSQMSQVFYTPKNYIRFANGLSYLAIKNDGTRNYMEQKYIPNASGSTGAQVAVDLPDGHNELWMSFHFYLPASWEYSKGGKMHGLGGGTYPSGGTPPTPGQGFSWRHMWRYNSGKHASYKRFEGYGYFSDMTQTYGEEIAYGPEARDPSRDAWHIMTQRVKLNTGSNFDAEVQAWLDGTLQHTWKGRLKDGGTFAIDRFRYVSFYGGDNSTWSPSTTTYARYRDFKIATAATGVDGIS